MTTADKSENINFGLTVCHWRVRYNPVILSNSRGTIKRKALYEIQTFLSYFVSIHTRATTLL